MGCYAASSGNSVPTFWDNLTYPIYKGQESLRNTPEESSCLLPCYVNISRRLSETTDTWRRVQF